MKPIQGLCPGLPSLPRSLAINITSISWEVANAAILMLVSTKIGGQDISCICRGIQVAYIAASWPMSSGMLLVSSTSKTDRIAINISKLCGKISIAPSSCKSRFLGQKGRDEPQMLVMVIFTGVLIIHVNQF